MKKKLALLIVGCLMVSLFAGCGLFGPKVGGQIIVGDTTEMSGDWEGTWQNNASDANIRELTTGYATVTTDRDGVYIWDDTVVKKHDAVINADKTKTFTIKIEKGLVYNDGTPITAKDYVGRIALFSSPVIKALGNRATTGLNYVGYNEFVGGENKVFTGVRLLSDYEFSVTVKEEYLPYYYDITFAAVTPAPLHMWLPEDVTLKDDGQGVYFSDNFTVTYEGEGEAKTAVVPEAIKAKIEEARYKAEGRVTPGPYQISSFDTSTKTCVVEINDKYKGNYEGQKPHVEKIIYVLAEEATMLDNLKTGGVDILIQLAEGAEISPALDLVDQGGFAYSKYDRAGYGLIEFHSDFGPTQFVEVRQAITMLLDRNEFARTFTGGYGSVVHGPYGVAMPEYKKAKAILDEKLNTYSFSIENAVKKLEEGGWTLGADGNAYTSGLRYKEVTAEQAGTYAGNVTLADGRILMPLNIQWLSSEGNSVSELLKVNLVEGTAVKEAGMNITQTVVAWNELLNYIYRDESVGAQYGVPTYGMFNLATGYPTTVYDMSYEWTSDPALIAQGYNRQRLFDEKLDKLSMDMVYGVESGDDETFLAKWTEYILRWNELVPQVPLYSNIYHDVYNEKLKDYEPNSYFTFTSAIMYAHIEE